MGTSLVGHKIGKRTVKTVMDGLFTKVGDMPINQAFPNEMTEDIDPFLLLHHAVAKIPKDRPVKQSGVGPHPHRGFSPVTFLFKGGIHHQDSRNNSKTVYAGGTQWMHAGMGIIHSERPADNIHEIGGEMELIQLWINTSSAHKMDQPYYMPLDAENTPAYTTEDEKVRINIITGEFFGIKGPIPTMSPMNNWTGEIRTGGKVTISIPEDHNAFIYLLDGAVGVEGYEESIKGKQTAIFQNDGTEITLTGIENSRFFIGTGLPLNEKVVAYGPFVMNSQTEILQAYRDYQMGKMGVLIEE